MLLLMVAFNRRKGKTFILAHQALCRHLQSSLCSGCSGAELLQADRHSVICVPRSCLGNASASVGAMADCNSRPAHSVGEVAASIERTDADFSYAKPSKAGHGEFAQLPRNSGKRRPRGSERINPPRWASARPGRRRCGDNPGELAWEGNSPRLRRLVCRRLRPSGTG
jgi:hypothetical protein